VFEIKQVVIIYTMAVQYKSGNLLQQSNIDAIVNTVNCLGVMGKGVALQFKHKWPDNFKAYASACKRGEVQPGRMFVFDSGGLVKPNFIINFPTKQHWRGASQLAWIEAGLHDLVRQVQARGIRSIAIPPLGCGNGGLDWKVVKPLIEQAFAALPDVQVHVFETSFSPVLRGAMPVDLPKMTAGRAALVKVIQSYKAMDFDLGKIAIQKLAYFLQKSGEPLNLNFEKQKFGPYADSLRHVLNKMEGIYIKGYSSEGSDSDINVTTEALAAADAFLQEQSHLALDHRIERVKQLIEGYETPYGLELLATVHWAANEVSASDSKQVLSAVHAWNDRKAKLMHANHVDAAWERLTQQGWLTNQIQITHLMQNTIEADVG
jgi:O-acetyl-ADP-ribose deacetylase (regulator of RNase III)